MAELGGDNLVEGEAAGEQPRVAGKPIDAVDGFLGYRGFVELDVAGDQDRDELSFLRRKRALGGGTMRTWSRSKSMPASRSIRLRSRLGCLVALIRSPLTALRSPRLAFRSARTHRNQ